MKKLTTLTSQYKLTALALLLSFGLAGCGGGGDDDKGSPAAGLGSTTEGTVDTGSSTQCTDNSDLEDVWLENRMDCIKVGQQFVDLTKNSTGTTANRAYNVFVLATQPDLTTVLGNKSYKPFLCVKNAPELKLINLRGDFGMLFKLNNQSSRPASVGYFGTSVLNANQVGIDRTNIVDSCDPSKFPIIIDFATGKVDSVNKAALSSVTTEMRYTWQDF